MDQWELAQWSFEGVAAQPAAGPGIWALAVASLALSCLAAGDGQAAEAAVLRLEAWEGPQTVHERCVGRPRARAWGHQDTMRGRGPCCA